MKKNLFDEIKSQHPEWSDEQIWTAVSIRQSADASIEKDPEIDPHDPKVWSSIISKAKDWLKEVMPKVFEAVKKLFADLLNMLKDWIKENGKDIVAAIFEIIATTTLGSSVRTDS